MKTKPARGGPESGPALHGGGMDLLLRVVLPRLEETMQKYGA